MHLTYGLRYNGQTKGQILITQKWMKYQLDSFIVEQMKPLSRAVRFYCFSHSFFSLTFIDNYLKVFLSRIFYMANIFPFRVIMPLTMMMSKRKNDAASKKSQTSLKKQSSDRFNSSWLLYIINSYLHFSMIFSNVWFFYPYFRKPVQGACWSYCRCLQGHGPWSWNRAESLPS